MVSVTGPQKRLTQYTGVENTTRNGRPAARSSVIVESCSCGSGTCPSSFVPARESTAAAGTSPMSSMVRLVTSGAGSPTVGTRCSSRTMKVPWPWTGPVAEVRLDGDAPQAGTVEVHARLVDAGALAALDDGGGVGMLGGHLRAGHGDPRRRGGGPCSGVARRSSGVPR